MPKSIKTQTVTIKFSHSQSMNTLSLIYNYAEYLSSLKEPGKSVQGKLQDLYEMASIIHKAINNPSEE